MARTLSLSDGECATVVAALDSFTRQLTSDVETVKHDPEHIEEVEELRKKFE
jgi:hypothetical protein